MSTKNILGKPISGVSLESKLQTGDEIANLDVFQAIVASFNASGEDITVSDTTQEIGTTPFHTQATTSHASSVASLADGDYVGQRKLITLDALGTAGDELALDEANIHNSSGTQATGVTFDAANEFLLVEWTGVEWQEVYGTATIATA